MEGDDNRRGIAVIPEVGVRLRHFSILENIKINKLSRIDLNTVSWNVTPISLLSWNLCQDKPLLLPVRVRWEEYIKKK